MNKKIIEGELILIPNNTDNDDPYTYQIALKEEDKKINFEKNVRTFYDIFDNLKKITDSLQHPKEEGIYHIFKNFPSMFLHN